MEALEQRLMSGEPPVLLLDQDSSYWELLIEFGLVALQRAEQRAGTPDGR
jgi:hypothetical protein